MTDAVATEKAKGVASSVRKAPIAAMRACRSSASPRPSSRLGTTVMRAKRPVAASVSRSVGEESSCWYWRVPTNSVDRPMMSLP